MANSLAQRPISDARIGRWLEELAESDGNPGGGAAAALMLAAAAALMSNFRRLRIGFGDRTARTHRPAGTGQAAAARRAGHGRP